MLARIAVLAAALVPRLVIAALTFGSEDAVACLRNSLEIFGGGWANTPYLPFVEIWLWVAGNAAYFTDLPVTFAYKVLPIAADALIALLLFDSARDERAGMRAAMLFAFNPVSIWISAIHMQWDSIVVYFLLLALVLLRLESRAATAAAGAALVMSIIVKPIALPLVLLLLPPARRRALAFLGGAAGLAAVYVGILAAIGWLLSADNLLFIFDYAQRGVQLFGMPLQPFNRVWTILAIVIGLWALVVKQRLHREEAVLLFFCAVMGVSGMSPQYLCWVVPFAILRNRTRFLAAYTLVAGLFLILYYQSPVVSLFNIENLGAYGLLKPFGSWSPPLPDSNWTAVVRVIGNWAIPLLSLGYLVYAIVRAVRKRESGDEPPTPPLPRALVPVLGLVVLIAAAAAWAAARPPIRDVAYIQRIEQKIAAQYDVIRYRGPAPPDRGKMWIARSFLDPRAGNRVLNMSNVAVLWVLLSTAAALWRRPVS